MYCPNCAAVIDGAKFCRSCGANVSLVPQALTGRLSEQPEDAAPAREAKQSKPGNTEAWDLFERVYLRDAKQSKPSKPANIESAVGSIFSGIGMFLVALAVLRFMPGGRIWWFWLLIPAFGWLGHGVGQYMKLRGQVLQERQPRESVSPPPVGPAEIQAPGSVTEHTTRRLDVDAER